MPTITDELATHLPNTISVAQTHTARTNTYDNAKSLSNAFE